MSMLLLLLLLIHLDFYGLIKNYLSHSHCEMLPFQIYQQAKSCTDHKQTLASCGLTHSCQENFLQGTHSLMVLTSICVLWGLSPLCAAVLLEDDPLLGLSNPTASFHRN